jgi:hypothetical protein
MHPRRHSAIFRVVTIVVLLTSLLLAAWSNVLPAKATSFFTDVSTTSGYGPAIYFIADETWITGYTDSPGYTPCANAGRSSPCFLPSFKATRGQISKMVVKAKQHEGTVLYIPANNTFADVPVGSTFFDYIETMNHYGWATGYPCGGAGEPCDGLNRPYFRPGNNTTRGQFAKMIVLSMNQIRNRITPSAPTFSDVPYGSTFYTYVETAWAHFAILKNGLYYDNSFVYGIGDDIVRGDIAQALFQLTPIDSTLVHNARYAGSNNYSIPAVACNPAAPSGSPTFLLGDLVGYATDYGGYSKYVAIAREIQFDQDAIDFLGCTANYKLAIVFHAFDNPQGSGNCQNGVYTANTSTAYTNLPRPVESRTQSACLFFGDHNEDRIVTNSPTSMIANSGQYFAMTEWTPSDSQLKGEMNVDNYELDSSYGAITGRKDNMHKYCYERTQNASIFHSPPTNRYGIDVCP